MRNAQANNSANYLAFPAGFLQSGARPDFFGFCKKGFGFFLVTRPVKVFSW
jgi:hypothetical protein